MSTQTTPQFAKRVPGHKRNPKRSPKANWRSDLPSDGESARVWQQLANEHLIGKKPTVALLQMPSMAVGAASVKDLMAPQMLYRADKPSAAADIYNQTSNLSLHFSSKGHTFANPMQQIASPVLSASPLSIVSLDDEVYIPPAKMRASPTFMRVASDLSPRAPEFRPALQAMQTKYVLSVCIINKSTKQRTWTHTPFRNAVDAQNAYNQVYLQTRAVHSDVLKFAQITQHVKDPRTGQSFVNPRQMYCSEEFRQMSSPEMATAMAIV